MKYAVTTIILCFLVMFMAYRSPGKEPRLPVLKVIYKIADDADCAVLETALRTNNVKTVGACKISKEQPSPWFPECIYSDGVSDKGERVLAKKCYFAKQVMVIQWIDPNTSETMKGK